MKKVLLAIITACISCQAFAAGYVNARVIAVRIDQTGNGMVTFDQNISGTPPGCVNVYQNALAFNTNTAGGKAIYAMALSAKATGNTISVHGLGTCSIFNGFVEDWDYGVVQ